jgi:CubicO group peptidase (beta-lactamase class C family)
MTSHSRSKFLYYFLLIGFLLLLTCQKNPTEPGKDSAYDWEISTPEEQGMDSEILSAAFLEAKNRAFIDGIVIIKNGYLVAEKYFNGYTKNSAHNVMSVSKSFLSALAGIAFREGYLDSLNQKMINFFPEYIYPDMDSRKYNITIRHLLMMRAGIDHEENNYFQIYNSANWIKTTIELPLLFDPGTKFYYNTFQTHLLSAIITKASNMSTLEFANKFLIKPLGISVHQWEQDPQGYYFGGNSMFFTPRNMARLGYLYLHGGNIEGNQIVPAQWVQESLTNFTGFTDNAWGDLKNYNYGYLWWLGELKGYKVFFALGHGGQYIMNFPALDMIIVTTSESRVDWDSADEQERSVLNVMADYILPALKN